MKSSFTIVKKHDRVRGFYVERGNRRILCKPLYLHPVNFL